MKFKQMLVDDRGGHSFWMVANLVDCGITLCWFSKNTASAAFFRSCFAAEAFSIQGSKKFKKLGDSQRQEDAQNTLKSSP